MRVVRVAVRRHALLGLAVFLVTTGLAIAFVLYRPPIYEARSLLSVDPKRSALPDVYERLALQETAIGTEMELLRSHSLAAAVNDDLGLQVSLTAPHRAARSTYLDSVTATPTAHRAKYRLTRQSSGEFIAIDRETGTTVAKARPGGRVTLPGASFVLRPAASNVSKIDVAVVPRQTSVEALTRELRIDRPARDANEITVALRGPDADLNATIVNRLVHRFVQQRAGVEQSDARGAATFLAAQIDTLSRQLHAAEDSLRRFREATGFVRGDEQANSEVRRAVALQADRGALDAERSALAGIVASADTASGGEGASASYRRLLAFPSLIKSPAASELLHSLTTLEDERAQLLPRRTNVDPQVHALTDRINSVNEQIRSLALTYLDGLDRQIMATDATLRQYQASLRAIPANEVTYARLDRSVHVLTDAYTMLQTRLKEAQIAQDATDPSLRIVDEAVAPDLPVSPGRMLSFAAAICIGLILAIVTCIIRAWMDPKVRTRTQAMIVSGAPVLGMIPSARSSQQFLRPKHHEGSTLIADVRPSKMIASSNPSESAALVERDVIRDAYSRVNTHLAHTLSPSIGRRIVLVTSALAGDGKTVSALQLARTAASNGQRVLLIDADLRRRGLTEQRGLAKARGLSDLLAGGLGDDHAIIHPLDREDGAHLDIVGAGIAQVEPAEALSTIAFAEWLTRLSSQYSAIVLDSPPVIVPDPIVLSRLVDGVVVVVRSDRTTNVALRSAMDELTQAEAPVVGLVLNDVDFAHPSRYDDDSAAYYGANYSYTAPLG